MRIFKVKVIKPRVNFYNLQFYGINTKMYKRLFYGIKMKMINHYK